MRSWKGFLFEFAATSGGLVLAAFAVYMYYGRGLKSWASVGVAGLGLALTALIAVIAGKRKL